MERIKSICCGVLIVADANLRLAPGQSADVATITPEMQSAINRSLLTKIDKSVPSVEIPAQAPETVDFSRLTANEAISRVGIETDPSKIKALLETEKRRSVIDAMKARLAEVQHDGK